MSPGRPESQREESPAQRSDGRLEPDEPAGRTTKNRGESVGEPDVQLDVPVLNVEEIDLEVENLRARVSFQTKLADMVKINVGIDAELGKAKLGVKGVEAQAQLKARLDNVRAIFSEVLTALERDPQLARNMLRAAKHTDETGGVTIRGFPKAGETADRGGGAAAEEAGRPGQNPTDESENVTKAAANEPTGAVADEGPSNLADLQIEEEYVDDRGRIVGRARDGSGKIVEEVLDQEGNAPGSDASGEAETEKTDGVEATRAARRKADEFGLKLSDMEGTGSGGRILVRDVQKAAKS